ncbi:hydrogenase [Oribacterium sp. C9]|uniref:NADH-dependent [FeFe] hydrogenase, group A6 n=1 Tax=Oribacterium sp. C9 TaxID=1943579 RepID=UPI00098E923A|nr:NADH-dependent [FeFe] hydrogenase, group A6 [Oribacterium sp. C9]OON88005.1 hydrogenase [Oribacterium sp. C9]
MVNVTIDGIKIQVPEKTTILDAASQAGVHIPTLCFMKELNEIGACRVCVVEVEGYDRLFTACNNTVAEGMVIKTNSKKARDARKVNVKLILSQHNTNCAVCVRSGNCTLQKVANDLNVHSIPYEKQLPENRGSLKFPLIRDYDKCIKCMRCIQVCDKIQNANIWDVVNTGSRVTVDVTGAYDLEDSQCALCGQCITHCPVGALRERDDVDRVLEAIEDPEKITVVQIAPSIRAAWGEPFGLDPEFATVKRLAAALRRVGVDYVFDTNFTADLTIMEEGSEFLEKISHPEHNKFPMFTSCCPGWVRYVKAHYPEFVDQLSSAKSPQQMFGAVAKSYFAEKLEVDPSKIFCVSIMPCLAKKAECAYPSMLDEQGDPEVDCSLTTREVNRLIRSEQIIVKDLPEEELDMPFGIGSGAGNIFGATGGVMEAALRSAYYLVNKENPDPDAFKSVRGMDGWKEAEFELAGKTLRVAVTNGLGNANKLLTYLKQGRVKYDFVEVMACPGGCVGGGGQPIHDGVEMAPERAPILYSQDKSMKLRFSHENPSVNEIYEKYFEAPLSERAHHLLHTDHHAWKMPGEK